MARSAASFVGLLLLLCTSSVQAQGPEAEAPRSQGVVLADDNGAHAERFSRFSAGPGGPLLISTELLAGLVTGGLIGHAHAPGGDGPFLGAMTGAVLLGGASAAYAYNVPLTLGAAASASIGATSAFFLALGLEQRLKLESAGAAWMRAGITQAGLLAVLLAQHGQKVSGSDAGLVGAGAVYALAFTYLGILGFAPESQNILQSLTPLLYAPAVGSALGLLMARWWDIEPGRLTRLALLPLGVGMLVGYAGAFFGPSRQALAGTVMVAVASTLIITTITTSRSEEPLAAPRSDGSTDRSVSLAPMSVPVAGGRSTAHGAGLFGTF